MATFVVLKWPPRLVIFSPHWALSRCHHEPSFQKRHSWVRDWAWLCAFCRLKAVSRLFWIRMWAGFDDDKGCRHPNGRVITKNFFGSVGFDFLIFYLILAFQPCHPLSYTHISFGTCATGVCALPSINITGCRWRGFAIATAACVPWPFLPERDEYILWCTCLEPPPPRPCHNNSQRGTSFAQWERNGKRRKIVGSSGNLGNTSLCDCCSDHVPTLDRLVQT